MKQLLIIVMLGLVVSGKARAEPGPVINFLIKEPASLLDIGLLRLDHDLDLWADKEDGVFSASAEYIWSRNRIVISIFSREPKFSEEECESIISGRRYVYGIVDGKSFIDGPSSVARLFGHEGYTSSGAPKGYHAKIDNIIEITVNMRGGSCQGPLLSKDVFYRTLNQ